MADSLQYWMKVNTSNYIDSYGYGDIISFNDRLFIAPAYNQTGTGGCIRKSTDDGESFGYDYLNGPLLKNARFVIADTLYVIDGYGNCYEYYNASDSWGAVNNPSSQIFNVTNIFSLVFLNDYIYCIYHDYVPSRNSHVWRTSDCVNWTLIMDDYSLNIEWGISGYEFPQSIVYDGKIFMMSQSLKNDILYSTDGIDWEGRDMLEDPTPYPIEPETSCVDVNLLEYDSKLWFLGGYHDNDNEATNAISYMSYFGTYTSWNRVTPVVPFTADRYRTSCVHNGHVYITGGISPDGIWRSCLESELTGKIWVRSSGSWVQGDVYVRDSGSWVLSKDVYARDNNYWKKSI